MNAIVNRKQIKDIISAVFNSPIETGDLKRSGDEWTVARYVWRQEGANELATAREMLTAHTDKMDIRPDYSKYDQNDLVFRLFPIDREAESALARENARIDAEYNDRREMCEYVWKGKKTGPRGCETWMSVEDLSMFNYALRFTLYAPMFENYYIVDIRAGEKKDDKGWYTLFLASYPDDVPFKTVRVFENDRVCLREYYSPNSPERARFEMRNMHDMRIVVGWIGQRQYKHDPAYPEFEDCATIYVRPRYDWDRDANVRRNLPDEVEINWGAWGSSSIETTDRFVNALHRATLIARILRDKTEAEAFEKSQL